MLSITNIIEFCSIIATILSLFTGALAPDCSEKVIEQCRSMPFSLMCDESNDLNSEKLFVLLVRGYDEATMKVTTRFLDMPVCNIGTAENLFSLIDERFK